MPIVVALLYAICAALCFVLAASGGSVVYMIAGAMFAVSGLIWLIIGVRE